VTNESRIQSNAIRRGIADVIPIHLLNLCTWQDLEWRVCGKPYIDIDLLKRHTEYSGVSPQAPYIRYFWQVLRSFSQEDRRAFVRFAWAQERLPTNDQVCCLFRKRECVCVCVCVCFNEFNLVFED
jgi:other hect domain ubiquitin protein ligase E3